MVLPITTTIAGAAALINVWLAVRVGAIRVGAKIEQGDGGNPRLLARMRAHGNYTEYTPFVLILLGLIEYQTGPKTWLWIASALYLLARLAHPIGMERPVPNPFRLGGILVTWAVLLVLACYALYLPYAGR